MTHTLNRIQKTVKNKKEKDYFEGFQQGLLYCSILWLLIIILAMLIYNKW
jgi:hypothetical protein